MPQEVATPYKHAWIPKLKHDQREADARLAVTALACSPKLSVPKSR